MAPVLVKVTDAMMKHHQQQLGEERIDLAYAFTSLFISEGNQDRDLESGAMPRGPPQGAKLLSLTVPIEG